MFAWRVWLESKNALLLWNWTSKQWIKTGLNIKCNWLPQMLTFQSLSCWTPKSMYLNLWTSKWNLQRLNHGTSSKSSQSCSAESHWSLGLESTEACRKCCNMHASCSAQAHWNDTLNSASQRPCCSQAHHSLVSQWSEKLKAASTKLKPLA